MNLAKFRVLIAAMWGAFWLFNCACITLAPSLREDRFVHYADVLELVWQTAILWLPPLIWLVASLLIPTQRKASGINVNHAQLTCSIGLTAICLIVIAALLLVTLYLVQFPMNAEGDLVGPTMNERVSEVVNFGLLLSIAVSLSYISTFRTKGKVIAEMDEKATQQVRKEYGLEEMARHNNESAEVLHRVSGVIDQPLLNVVFVHGVDGHWQKTWQATKDEGSFWPAWLAHEMPRVVVWSYHYHAATSHWWGKTMPLPDRAGNTLGRLDLDGIFKLPTVFVVHSFGGLVVKALWREAHDRQRQDIIRSIMGVVFLATPHTGAHLGSYLQWTLLKLAARPTVTVEDLRSSEPHLRQLNTWYVNHPMPFNAVYFETQPLVVDMMVVDATSAQLSLPGIYPTAILANHITICKPDDRNAMVYKGVKQAIEKVLKALQELAEKCEQAGTDTEPATSELRGIIDTTIEEASQSKDLLDYQLEHQHWHNLTMPSIIELESGKIGLFSREIDVVLLTATEVETVAVLRLLKPYPRRKSVLLCHLNQETYYLGKFGAFKAAVTRCQMGSVGPGAAALAAECAQRMWQPRAIIMTGIAFGKDSKGQSIADVLVASHIIMYEIQRMGAKPIFRGAISPSNATLLNRFDKPLQWQFLKPDGSACRCHVGHILSGEKLVDDPVFKASLFADFPQAIGGEMEGAGLCAASGRLGGPWMLVKAICDWGDGKKQKHHQPLAAAAATSLVYHVLSRKGALDGLEKR